MHFSPLHELLSREWTTDRVSDDVTAALLGAAGEAPAVALVKSREAGVFAGRDWIRAHDQLCPDVRFEALLQDGDTLAAGTEVARLAGPVGRCLSLERTLLNGLSHLCGIATLTRQFVCAVPPSTKILATRKTLPGLRELQLAAVVAGGGHVHRRSLSDGILIKDNHLAVLGEQECLERAKHRRSPLHRVEIEVQSLASLEKALPLAPDVVMLDNLTVDEMREAIARIGKRCEIEISGGVSLDTIGALARLGVDYISIGRLTHSVKALDLTLDIDRE